MNILVVTNMYPSHQNPCYGIFVREQVDSIRRLDVNVDIYFINGRQKRSNYFFAVKDLLKIIKSKSYQLIHAHHTYCIPPIKMAQKILNTRIPVIATLHEGEILAPRRLRGCKGFWSRLRYSRFFKWYFLRKVNYIISVYQRLLPEIFEAEEMIKFSVIPCGIDIQKFKPMDKGFSRKELDILLDEKVIFFPSDPNRLEDKNFPLLKKTLAILNKKEIHLITAGQIEYNKMPIYYNASDIVVQTSNYEASPTVIKEAMACNVPIVSTDVGDVREIFGEVEGCHLCSLNPNDVAEKIKLALNFGRATKGRKRILELGLDLESTAKRVVEVYEEVLYDAYCRYI